jgi:hypothetical protein
MNVDQATIEAAILASPVVIRIDALIHEHKTSEAARIAEAKAKLQVLYQEIRDLKAQRVEINRRIGDKVRAMQNTERLTAIDRKPLWDLRVRRDTAIKNLKLKLEKTWIREQRIAFRRAHGLNVTEVEGYDGRTSANSTTASTTTEL